MKNLSLEFGSNMFGKLKPHIKKRLQAVIDNPCQETWEDAYTLILNSTGRMTTLWQAVCKVDWMFPTRKPLDDKWERIPTREVIIEAINKAVFTENEKRLN